MRPLIYLGQNGLVEAVGLEHLKCRVQSSVKLRNYQGRKMKKAPSRRSEEVWQWPPTEWSASGHIPSALGRDPECINALILKYQAPLKAYLLAAFPRMDDKAEELLQDFVEDRILKEGWLNKAERKRGRVYALLRP